ncbi:aminopyrimidine aminohydrolase [Companilactobacillus sp. RD055328]|uniref:thiaminase II n=1 Tax=Companilactobacillus sp. RD055328 TaxID=2916634 RepID=UPI001FC7EB8A|nr:thiaminase II [Companilactobacillus sp. RD055328]GKQ42396.1 aminopyrimidine aminohydrolase [Companilactobacillus sp. RD055328]
MSKKITDLAYEKSYKPWHDSFKHPFITELHAGTLDPTIFRYYLLQDRYYLEHFGKLYDLIAQQTDNAKLKSALQENSAGLEAGEFAIREIFFRELNITDKEIKNTPVAPTTYNYVSHMYRQLYVESPLVAAASMLPCEWLYQEIGEYLSTKDSPIPIYQQWIDSYATEEAKLGVQKQRALIDELAEETSPIEQQKILEAFEISTQMEYKFWEMSYAKETW